MKISEKVGCKCFEHEINITIHDLMVRTHSEKSIIRLPHHCVKSERANTQTKATTTSLGGKTPCDRYCICSLLVIKVLGRTQ